MGAPDYPVFGDCGEYVMMVAGPVGGVYVVPTAGMVESCDELVATAGKWFGVDTDGIYQIRGYAVDPDLVDADELLARGTKIRVDPSDDMVALYGSRGRATEAMALELGLTWEVASDG